MGKRKVKFTLSRKRDYVEVGKTSDIYSLAGLEQLVNMWKEETSGIKPEDVYVELEEERGWYDDRTTYLKCYYYKDEPQEEWEARCKDFNEKQKIRDKEEAKKKEEKELETFLRLKKKYEGTI